MKTKTILQTLAAVGLLAILSLASIIHATTIKPKPMKITLQALMFVKGVQLTDKTVIIYRVFKTNGDMLQESITPGFGGALGEISEFSTGRRFAFDRQSKVITERPISAPERVRSASAKSKDCHHQFGPDSECSPGPVILGYQTLRVKLGKNTQNETYMAPELGWAVLRQITDGGGPYRTEYHALSVALLESDPDFEAEKLYRRVPDTLEYIRAAKGYRGQKMTAGEIQRLTLQRDMEAKLQKADLDEKRALLRFYVERAIRSCSAVVGG